MSKDTQSSHIMIRQGITWYNPETEIDVIGWLSYETFLWHIWSY